MILDITAPAFLSLSGGLLMIAAIVEFVFATSFCTKPAPNWIRQGRTFGLVLIGARLLTRDNASIDLDAWFVVSLWTYLALAQTVVAGYTVANIQPPDSEVCRREREGRVGNIVKAGIFILGFLLAIGAVGVTGAQEKPVASDGGKPAEDFEVIVGDYAYPLDPRDPVQGCVVSIEQGQDGEGTLSYRLFVREQASEGPIFNSVGIYSDNAEDFPGVEVNECFGTRMPNG